MARLISRHALTIDGKNRLVLPAAHRARYADGTVVSPRGNHLAIYEPAEWDRYEAELVEARRTGGMDREVFNWIMTQTIDPEPDNAGRILIPRWLRDLVGIDSEVIVAGHGDYLGIHPGDYVTNIDPAIAAAAAASINSLGL